MSTTVKGILLILGILACIAATQMMAQNAQGVITYEIKINMHRNLPEDRQERKSMIPEYRTSLDQLFFNEEESLYRPVQEEPEEALDSGQGVRMMLRRPKYEIYTRHGESKRVMVQEFMGKKYLIEDSIKVRPWKLGSEMKEINGYACRQATLFDHERKMNVVAWYSDQFRPFLGPENYNTLPGAVLLVDINDGERIIAAKNIEMRPLEKNEMKIPTAKVRVTELEYHTMVREQMERMRANGGNMIIRN
ncbi:MAG: GLPGLI family protein [Cyclobacteriaceae bacterium]